MTIFYIANAAAAAVDAAAEREARRQAFEAQTGTLVRESTAWLQLHWLEIAIATGIAVAIFFAVEGLKAIRNRLDPDED